jgi:hypothetical protein
MILLLFLVQEFKIQCNILEGDQVLLLHRQGKGDDEFILHPWLLWF